MYIDILCTFSTYLYLCVFLPWMESECKNNLVQYNKLMFKLALSMVELIRILYQRI